MEYKKINKNSLSFCKRDIKAEVEELVNELRQCDDETIIEVEWQKGYSSPASCCTAILRFRELLGDDIFIKRKYNRVFLVKERK